MVFSNAAIDPMIRFDEMGDLFTNKFTRNPILHSYVYGEALTKMEINNRTLRMVKDQLFRKALTKSDLILNNSFNPKSILLKQKVNNCITNSEYKLRNILKRTNPESIQDPWEFHLDRYNILYGKDREFKSKWCKEFSVFYKNQHLLYKSKQLSGYFHIPGKFCMGITHNTIEIVAELMQLISLN